MVLLRNEVQPRTFRRAYQGHGASVRHIDLAVIGFLNSFAGASRAFDIFMVSIASNNLFKGGPILAAIWGLWFARIGANEQQQRRARIVSIVAAACIAAALSVALTQVLPIRPRPLVEPQLDFVLPYSMTVGGWERASSLPSDHAAMFFALAGGLCMLSTRWGWLAMVHVLLFIAFPRAYLGLHYFSDLLAGAAIGLACVGIANTRWVLSGFSQRVISSEGRHPGIFYAAAFLISFQMAGLFHESRSLAKSVKSVIAALW